MTTTHRDASTPTRRQRGREAAILDIKAAALDELRRHGAGGVTMRGVARAIDMTPSGLYRYFDDHGALLAALCVDAHDSLRDALEAARTAIGADDCTSIWYEGSLAMRAWALTHVDEYGLIVGPPLTGLQTAHPAVAESAGRLLTIPAETIACAVANGELRPPPVSLASWSGAPRPKQHAAVPMEMNALAVVPVEARALAVGAISALVGMVSLESFGHLPGIVPDHEAFFRAFSLQVMKGMGFSGAPRRHASEAAS